MTRPLDSLIMLGVLLLIWQGLFLYAGDVAITPPDRTVLFAGQLLGSATFWLNAQATMLAFVYALAISAVAGIGLGLLLGLRRFAGDVAEPILASFYTIPKVTLYPVMLLLFGLGLSAKVAFGVIHGMIPITLFTLAAVKNIPPSCSAPPAPCASPRRRPQRASSPPPSSPRSSPAYASASR